ncbi:hypothetical protein DPEC_G00374860 [Dallia pectoralis]|nr:hypothetical protein DPEC_G00374860 [Dallia pectoralis]
MQSYQATVRRLYFLSVSIVYLLYDLTPGDLTQRNAAWLAGYKVLFLAAAVKSVTSYVCLELNAVVERTRQLQCSALSTTSKGETLALYREERRLDSVSASARYCKQAFGHVERIPFNPHDQYEQAPVFWCSLMTLLALYNTAHLLLVPMAYASPLFFGTPTYVLYRVALRITQVMSS